MRAARIEVDVADQEARDLADPQGRRGQDRHHVAVRLVPAGLDHAGDEPLQRRDVRQRQIARVADRLLRTGAANGPATRAVLRRVAGDDAVAHRLVEHQTRAATVFFTVDRP